MSVSAVSSPGSLLEGPLFGKIIRFVLPLMITNLLQTLYNAADMMIVGLSGVEGAIGSIGTTAAMINLVINSFIGFSVGANVVVARDIGAGDEEKTHRAVHTSLCISILFGLAGCVLGQAVTRPVLILLGDEGRILELATTYARIYFAGAPFLSVTNFCTAILRARGDTKTPLYILALSGLVNVGLNLLFVLGFGMSVDGVALATVLSNVLSSILLMLKLRKDDGWCRLQLRKLRIHWRTFGEILYVGVPAGIQGALFSVSNMLIQSSVISVNNRMYPGGSAVIDGNAAGSNLEGFAYVSANAITQATVTFTSQHHGAGKYRRMGKVIKNCYLISFLVTVLMGWGIYFGQDFLIRLYVRDPAAVDVARIRNGIMLTTYCTLGAMEVGIGLLRGLGRSVTSMVVCLIGACAFRIVWIYTAFRVWPVLECIYWSYPISWILTAAVTFVLSIRLWRKFSAAEELPSQGG